MTKSPDQQLFAIFQAALDSVTAEKRLASRLPDIPEGRTIIVGAGKASGAMARALERVWQGTLSGIVVTPYGQDLSCNRIELIEAAHPIPDVAGERAARRIISTVQGLEQDDLVIALISGGGSALLPIPAPGLTLADKQAVARALLRSGATIGEMNTVRKHLSAIKGGQLAQAAHPAQITTLVVSDVPGDIPSTVASGPTLPDPTTVDEARLILADYRIKQPTSVTAHLANSRAETPKPGDRAFDRDSVSIIARAKDALDAAASAAKFSGGTVEILGDSIEGEACEIAREQARLTINRLDTTTDQPHFILSGGETSVTVDNRDGIGGRNTEYLLALALALEGHREIWALACDTDGLDGNSNAAGAILRPDSLARARQLGLDPQQALEDHDSATLFAAIGDLVVTGPTGTNVNDIRAILINTSPNATATL